MNVADHVSLHFSQIAEALSLVDITEIEKAIKILGDTIDEEGTVWLAGNGGSAATASHFANDLCKIAHVKAITVSELTPTVLAYGNDFGWENMFSGFIKRYIGINDVVVGLSCSGESDNIIEFLRAANGNPTIAFTGPGMNSVASLGSDVIIRAMSDEITVQEDVHLAVCHAIVRGICHA